MSERIKIIQLFSDDSFFIKLEDQLSTFEKNFELSQSCPKNYLTEVTPVTRDLIFLINSEILLEFSDILLIYGLSNWIVYIYKTEDELYANSNILLVSDLVLDYKFSKGSLFSTFNICKKNIQGNNLTQYNHSFPKKMVGFGLNIPDLIVRDSITRLFLINDRNQFLGCNHLFAIDCKLESSQKIIGKTGDDLLDKMSVNEFSSVNKKVFETGECVIGYETEIILINGIKKHVKINCFPLKDSTGVTRCLIVKYELISEKQGEGMIHFSDQKLLQFLMDNITDLIYFKDSESKFVRINKSLATFIGEKSAHATIGKTDFDYYNIEHAKKAFSDEQKMVLDGKPINRIEYVGTKDGTYRWLNSSKVPVFDGFGKIIGIAGITHDIDKMIKVEHRLKAERDLLQLLIDNIPSPIYFKDKESKFTRVNRAQSRLLGANSNEEVLGKSDFNFYSFENASVYYSDEKEIIEKNKPLINKIEECYPPGEGLRWFSTTKIPITDEDGELSGILGVSHDITDQILVKQDLEIAKERAEVASKAKSNFLSNMSHEIRTPMNGVVGMAEVLNMTELDQEQKKIVNLIIRSGNNLLNIINDILDFSKIENGKLEIESVPIDLKSIIREVVEMMMFSISDRNIILNHKIDPNIPEFVIGDSLRIKQVLINLVSNAIKFTKEGEIVVEANFLGNSNEMNCIVFKVKDTGIGINHNDKVNLFAAFTQADASTSRKYGGTGLGLAISSRLVEIMGGKLDVISEKGKGSVFFFDVCFKRVAIADSDKI
jgi:two-component system, sensor histidine kinase and response regulator